MTLADLIVRSTRVVHSGEVGPATVWIHRGTIVKVSAYDDIPGKVRVLDTKHSVVMPGLVDTHVHINDPGREEWEGFDAATRAAAAGGVTCLVDMPLNSIPATTTIDALGAKLGAGRDKCWVDTGLWGGVVPGNARELRALWSIGVLGFKCFLTPSGVPEFPHVTEKDLREPMFVLQSMGAPLLVHAELPQYLPQSVPGNVASYANYLRSRPREAEHEAIAMMIRLCRDFGTRVHIVHLSSADAVPMLRQARAEGLPITVETCPHYLMFCAEEIPDGATHFKCAPPIRERENRERLWQALAQGVIDFVATDHSPCPEPMKLPQTGDFLRAWGGIASLGLQLPVMWTMARKRRIPLPRLAAWLCEEPAKFCGLGGRKGSIAVGCDADLVVWNPEGSREWHGYHKLTPYACESLYGVVEQTYLRGNLIWDFGRLCESPQGTCGIHRSH